MIVIQGSLRLSPDKVEQARDAARAMIPATRAEDGCIAYTFAEDVLDPGLIHIIERWRDQAAINAHMKTPHMAAFNAAIGPLKPTALKVSAFDAAEERVLMGG